MKTTFFKKINPPIRKRKDIKISSDSENKHLKELENFLLIKGLTKKVSLENHEFPGPYKIHTESILYTNENNSMGLILYINSLKGNQERRYDYIFYPIGSKKFQKDITSSLKNTKI